MATKEELQNEVMTLKGRVAELEGQLAEREDQLAGALTVNAVAGAPVDEGVAAHMARSAAWVEAAGLQVIADVTEAAEGGAGVVNGWLLCTAEGLPANGVIVDGEFMQNDEGLDQMPTDAAGNDLVAGNTYTVELTPRQEGGATFRLHAVKHVTADGAPNGVPVASWNYEEGTGFVHVQDGTVVALERWRVRNEDGTFSEPQAGRAYVYDGSHDLVAVATGDLSSVAQENEALKLDKLRLATHVDELRAANAALQRRVDAGAMLHGAVDQLPPVV